MCNGVVRPIDGGDQYGAFEWWCASTPDAPEIPVVVRRRDAWQKRAPGGARRAGNDVYGPGSELTAAGRTN